MAIPRIKEKTSITQPRLSTVLALLQTHYTETSQGEHHRITLGHQSSLLRLLEKLNSQSNVLLKTEETATHCQFDCQKLESKKLSKEFFYLNDKNACIELNNVNSR